MEKEYLFVMVTGIFSGLIVFGVQIFADLGLSFFQISMFHAIFILVLLPLVIFKKECRINKEMLKFFVLFGFFAALANFTEFGPVILGIPIAIVVLLLYTQPLWTIILGRIFLKEEITRNKIISVILVFLGVVILINPFTGIGDMNVFGLLLALMGGLLMSVWIIMGRVSGIKKYNPVSTQFGYYIFNLIFLIIFYPIVAFFIADPMIVNLSFNLPLEIWFYLMLFLVFAIVIPHIFYFYGVRRVRASDAGVILLLEPVGATILALAFLLQPVTLNILLGGGLILISNYIVIRKSKLHPPADYGA